MGEGKFVVKIALPPTNCLDWQMNYLGMVKDILN